MAVVLVAATKAVSAAPTVAVVAVMAVVAAAVTDPRGGRPLGRCQQTPGTPWSFFCLSGPRRQSAWCQRGPDSSLQIGYPGAVFVKHLVGCYPVVAPDQQHRQMRFHLVQVDPNAQVFPMEFDAGAVIAVGQCLRFANHNV